MGSQQFEHVGGLVKEKSGFEIEALFKLANISGHTNATNKVKMHMIQLSLFKAVLLLLVEHICLSCSHIYDFWATYK